jgi:hypothetical protein
MADANTQWDALGREFEAMLRSQSSNLRFRLLNLSNNEQPVAYLISPRPADGPIVLPVGRGVTLVGRAAPANYVVERRSLSGIVEGAQWRISWSPEEVSIRDAGSTNGSVLVRRADRGQVPSALNELQQDHRVLLLGWDGSRANEAAQLVTDGDLLVNAYGPFLYWSDDDASQRNRA